MAKDVRSWRLEIDEFMDEEVVGEAVDVQKRIMAYLLTQVVQITPVGDKSTWKRNQGKPANKQLPKGYVGGHARKNWQITINQPAKTQVTGEDRGGNQTIQRGLRSIANIKEPTVAYLSNLLPYMDRLENGWSRKQAPQGIVRPALQQLRQKFGLNK